MKFWLLLRKHRFSFMTILYSALGLNCSIKALPPAECGFLAATMEDIYLFFALFSPQSNPFLRLIICEVVFVCFIENQEVLVLFKEAFLQSCPAKFCTLITLLAFR